MRIVREGRFFGAVEHFHIANLLPAFDVVINNRLIVVQIDGVYKNVNNAFSEFHIVEIAFTKLFEPHFYLFFGKLDAGGNTQFCNINFKIGFLNVEQFHLVEYRLTRGGRANGERIDKGTYFTVDPL